MSDHPIDRTRRKFFAGSAAVGAAAVGAVVLPGVQTAPAAPQAQPAPERGGGYRVSEHVKRYYKTTLV
ncbi:formate dehydrogenase [Bordetella genomosp. 5]|uniref:Formate dehydrogenase n=1 Tax=Bordetella genomosp. 5 TaxID=1395608 RepID=A0A261TRQ2_9BORD|nr:twin-arginine translocation signal domain-containing protein [Bordetella genomosp. 5]OZI43753.1 formate dehydrogenase [Bordetella genomosp. 5]OZI51947.1 formate dehydrogenase [Bordetella genomosp. 5]